MNCSCLHDSSLSTALTSLGYEHLTSYSEMERVYLAALKNHTLSLGSRESKHLTCLAIGLEVICSPWHKVEDSTNTRRRSGPGLPKYNKYPANIIREILQSGRKYREQKDFKEEKRKTKKKSLLCMSFFFL